MYPEPSDYDDISFSYSNREINVIYADETDYGSIMRDNHSALIIKHDAIPFQPRKCYCISVYCSVAVILAITSLSKILLPKYLLLSL